MASFPSFGVDAADAADVTAAAVMGAISEVATAAATSVCGRDGGWRWAAAAEHLCMCRPRQGRPVADGRRVHHPLMPARVTTVADATVSSRTPCGWLGSFQLRRQPVDDKVRCWAVMGI